LVSFSAPAARLFAGVRFLARAFGTPIGCLVIGQPARPENR
jgi:hypothetical protein